MEAISGAPFVKREEYVELLRQGPSAEAKDVAAKSKGPRPARWTLKSIRNTFEELHDYTLSGVRRFVMVHLGAKLRSALIQHFSPDPDYAKKLSRLKRCLHQTRDSPRQVRCVFLDEMGFECWPEPARNWAVEAPVADRLGADNSTWRVIAAMDAWTGQVTYLDNYIVGRRQVIKFYERLAAVYRRAERIYVVQDNWNIHNHPDVLEALQRWPQIKPIWLPTYAPWLNPIEKLWKWLRQDVLQLHRLADDWSALKAAVRDFLEQFHCGSRALLDYVGLSHDGQLARCLKPKPNPHIRK